MAQLPENKLRAVTESALEAFWASVAERFPEAESGDVSPQPAIELKLAAEKAVAEWIENNL